eukprot:349907-Chlamydomonas_euryale.AAC.9
MPNPCTLNLPVHVIDMMLSTASAFLPPLPSSSSSQARASEVLGSVHAQARRRERAGTSALARQRRWQRPAAPQAGPRPHARSRAAALLPSAQSSDPGMRSFIIGRWPRVGGGLGVGPRLPARVAHPTTDHAHHVDTSHPGNPSPLTCKGLPATRKPTAVRVARRCFEAPARGVYPASTRSPPSPICPPSAASACRCEEPAFRAAPRNALVSLQGVLIPQTRPGPPPCPSLAVRGTPGTSDPAPPQ